MANVLKDTVRAIGEDVLNIKADEVGTYSSHVHRRTTCVPDHVDGPVVERCIPTLH